MKMYFEPIPSELESGLSYIKAAAIGSPTVIYGIGVTPQGADKLVKLSQTSGGSFMWKVVEVPSDLRPNSMDQIDCAADGTVVIIDQFYRPWQYVSSLQSWYEYGFYPGSNPGSVSVGSAGLIYGVLSSDQIFRLCSINGSTIVEVGAANPEESGYLRKITVAEDGTVLALGDLDGVTPLFRYVNDLPDGQKVINVNNTIFRSISAASASAIYGITHDNKLMRLYLLGHSELIEPYEYVIQDGVITEQPLTANFGVINCGTTNQMMLMADAGTLDVTIYWSIPAIEGVSEDD